MSLRDEPRLLLCLLPGLDGTGLLYEPLIRELADFDIDLCSYPSDVFRGYGELVEYIEHRFPKDRDFVVVAESFSGPLALKLAANGHARLRSIVLAASFSTAPIFAASRLASLLGILPPLLPPRILLHSWLLGSKADAAIAQTLGLALAQVPTRILRDRAIGALKVDVRKELRKIAIPLLYLRGRQDRLIAAGIGKKLVSECRYGELIDIDAPHFVSRWRLAKPPRKSGISSDAKWAIPGRSRGSTPASAPPGPG